jgi:hypothetical protein
VASTDLPPVIVSDYTPKDSFFGTPFIDMDEWRAEPLPHRYIHGGFGGTDARFSFYLPSAEVYQGRLVMVFGGARGGDERSAQTIGQVLNSHHNAFSNGAYLIESNQGHIGASVEGLRGDESIQNGRTDVETARLSHHVAEQVYGQRPRHSYCYGGSGGGNFTIYALEREDTVFDGGVPFMFGGSSFPETMNAVRLLRPKIRGIVDATRAGGGGDPFAGLDTTQREALASLYRAGFQRGAEFQLVLPMPEISWPTCANMMALRNTDPSYFADFWNERGYKGGDGMLEGAAFEVQASVKRVLTADEIVLATADGFVPRMLAALGAGGRLGIELEGVDPADYTCATITVRTGAAAGRRLYNFLVLGNRILVPAGLGSFFDPTLVDGLQPGDEVTVDNRDFLAYCHLGRHLPFHGLSFRQYEVAGTPVYPVRAGAGPLLPPFGARFAGKMILIQHLLDRPCWPTVAVQYQRDAAANLRAGLDDHFRLWWSENAQHGPGSRALGNATRAIDYTGLISQALKDVIAWVEEGTEPAPSYRYDFTDGQVLLDPDVAVRGGIQPSVRATANGAARVEVRVGEPVTLAVDSAAPPGTGTITGVSWDLDDSGTWPLTVEGIDGTQAAIKVATTHAYDKPGTYFATARVRSRRDGDASASSEQVENLAAVRVVVTA